MKNIDLALLRTYLAIAEAGSFASAAKVVGRTAAAISYQIARLEDSIEQKLFVREGRRLILSGAGHQFLAQARSLLKVHDDMMGSNKGSSIPPLTENGASTKIAAVASGTNLPARRISVFEDHLETPLLKSVFSLWKSFQADGKPLALDDLKKRGLVCFTKDHLLLADFIESDLCFVGASVEPTRLLQLDKLGFGVKADQIWRSRKQFEARRKIFSICRDVNAPVFFSGNAPVPSHLDTYQRTIDKFASTRLDRLLLPIALSSGTRNSISILQILEFRGRLTLPFPKSTGLSKEERMENLNFIGNVAIAV